VSQLKTMLKVKRYIVAEFENMLMDNWRWGWKMADLRYPIGIFSFEDPLKMNLDGKRRPTFL
jgi:hypothetical protein